MKRANLLISVASSLSLIVLSSTSFAGKPAPKAGPPAPPANPPVTTTIYDTDSLGSPRLTSSDDYNGTGYATYTSVGSVTSQLAGGTWQLILLNQSLRKIFLTLASQGAPVPDGLYSASVEAYVQCFDASLNLKSLVTIDPGTSYNNCSFGVDFQSGSIKYKLTMSPKNAPGTGRSKVTCTAGTTGNCTAWTFESDASVANADVANLYKFGNRGNLTLIGVYHNTYNVNVSNP